MTQPIYIEAVPAAAKKENILFRMGYKRGITRLSAEDEAKLDIDIKKAAALCALKAAYLEAGISAEAPDKIMFNTGAVLRSKALFKLLEGCGSAILMAATAGSLVVDARDREITGGDASFGLVLDATASETADAGLDFIQDMLSSQLAKNGRQLTQRFSPGYQDLDLSAQKTLYDLLSAGKIGITITGSHLLIPEKSVMAVAGIRP